MEPTHIYKERVRGRSLVLNPRQGTKAAHVTCSQCGGGSSFRCMTLPPPEILDKKFVQRGWSLDPNICPTCKGATRKAKAEAKAEVRASRPAQNTIEEHNEVITGTLAENPTLKAVSIDAHKATAKMHQLLNLHFDGETGKFTDGWNDERISKESGMSITHVAEVRSVAYGDLKEPEELTSLRNDIKALHDLITETLIAAQKEVNALNNRAADIAKKLGVK